MTPEQKIALFGSLFRGRQDVYAQRWDSSTGSGYRPVHAPLTAQVLGRHLLGHGVIGVYPLLQDNNTWFLAIDCDGPQAARDAKALAIQCQSRDLPVALERSRSGQGYHLWFFFYQPLPAQKARDFAKHLVQSAGVELPSLDRFFPSQDAHTGPKGLGNLIALPLQKQARPQNTVFVDPQTLEPLAHQWRTLSLLSRLKEEDLDLVLSEPADALYAPLPLLKPAPFSPKSAPETLDSPIQVTLKEHLEVQLPCPKHVIDFLREASRFPNPVWFQKVKRNQYLGDTPRFIRCGARVGERWVATRGLWPRLHDLLLQAGMPYTFDDQRVSPQPVDWQKDFQLRDDQLQVVQSLLPHHEAVLEAPTGAGKTMIALEMLVRRGLPSLIIVPSRALLDQWVERCEESLALGKRQIGLVRQGKLTLGHQVTITTFQSLLKRDFTELVHHCGHVVVDECHHAPAKTFAAVLRQLKPKYLLGLSATPRRKDKLERLIFAYLGTKIKSATPKELDRRSIIVLPHLVHHRTAFEHPQEDHIQAILGRVSRDAIRNRQIAADVVEAVGDGHLVLLLSDRKEHCDLLGEELGSRVGTATLYGRVGKKAKKKVFSEFEQGVVQVLISTARLLGEGWDCPPLSALFLAFPMGGAPRLEQLVGRLTRPDPNKPTPVVHDYLDHKVPVLQVMFNRRLKIFRGLLGNDRLPAEFQNPGRTKKATIRYGAKRSRPQRPSKSMDSDQLSLFD